MSRRDIIKALVTNFRKSFRRPPPPKPVGEDHLGNKYFEFIPDEYYSHRKGKRTVQPVDESIDYELPFEWEAWLRGKRRDPPTSEEIQERIARQAQAVANAERVDAANGKASEVASPRKYPKLEGYHSQPSGSVIRRKDCIEE